MSKINFYREEIDVKIESLKNELDDIRDEFNGKIDQAQNEALA